MKRLIILPPPPRPTTPMHSTRAPFALMICIMFLLSIPGKGQDLQSSASSFPVFSCATANVTSEKLQQESSQATNQSYGMLLPCPESFSSNKTVRINIHFVLRGNGTGNYTETGDGRGGSTTGYQIAQNLVNTGNALLAANQKVFQQPGNNIPVKPIRIQWVLNGVYFDRDDALYTHIALGNFGPYGAYLQNPGNEINVFFHGDNFLTGSDGKVYSAQASSIGFNDNSNIVRIYDRMYLSFNDNVYYNGFPSKSYFFGHLLNHELCHILNLNHPHDPDNLDDTYSLDQGQYSYYPRCPNTNPYDGNCAATDAVYTNTHMNYHMNWPAATPLQIERMHNNLRGTTGRDYIASCFCYTHSSFYLTGVENGQLTVDCGYSNFPVWFDGSTSENETSYTIKVENQYFPAETVSQTFSGEVGIIDLRSFYPYFVAGNSYRVILETNNDCNGVNSSESIVFIQENCGLWSSALRISPNPVSDVLKVEISAPVDDEIELDIVSAYSYESRVYKHVSAPVKVRAAQKYAYTLSVSELAEGVYGIRLKSSKELIVKKFIVKR